METFRTLVNLERQAWSVFAAADVLLVAYGLYIKLAGPIAFGILVLVALLVSAIAIHRHLIPIGYVIYANERVLGSPHGVCITFVSTRAPGLLSEYKRVAAAAPDLRAGMLRRIDSGELGSRSVVAISGLIAAQAIVAGMTLAAGYPLF